MLPLGAVSVALLRVLQRFGIEAHAVAGHSFGELVALHAAGVIDEPTLRELARLRVGTKAPIVLIPELPHEGLIDKMADALAAWRLAP